MLMIKAPDFTLPSTQSTMSLENLKGSPTILVFYPEDGTDVCSAQLSVYNQAMTLFEKHGAQIVGISTDDLSRHEKFAKKLNLKFPLLSDSEPQGKVSKLYDAYNKKTQKSKRSIFVLDAEGNIFWSQTVPEHINPGAEGILEALDQLEQD